MINQFDSQEMFSILKCINKEIQDNEKITDETKHRIEKIISKTEVMQQFNLDQQDLLNLFDQNFSK